MAGFCFETTKTPEVKLQLRFAGAQLIHGCFVWKAAVRRETAAQKTGLWRNTPPIAAAVGQKNEGKMQPSAAPGMNSHHVHPINALE
jgi:hypothetical protein